ncbi:hypothetical protein H4Q26_013009 [Puccinia striiformis f. sp. tritici PST-130]|nr:hypothetical protein H4Q26_013009 [Puccinia striiformis f. sp. tritici PST-130]
MLTLFSHLVPCCTLSSLQSLRRRPTCGWSYTKDTTQAPLEEGRSTAGQQQTGPRAGRLATSTTGHQDGTASSSGRPAWHRRATRAFRQNGVKANADKCKEA